MFAPRRILALAGLAVVIGVLAGVANAEPKNQWPFTRTAADTRFAQSAGRSVAVPPQAGSEERAAVHSRGRCNDQESASRLRRACRGERKFGRHRLAARGVARGRGDHAHRRGTRVLPQHAVHDAAAGVRTSTLGGGGANGRGGERPPLPRYSLHDADTDHPRLRSRSRRRDRHPACARLAGARARRSHDRLGQSDARQDDRECPARARAGRTRRHSRLRGCRRAVHPWT